MSSPSDAAHSLRHVSPYVYGTARLGDPAIDFAQRVRTARAAMEQGIWFHTSKQYGDALAVLRAAFAQDKARVPRLIGKIGRESVAEVRHSLGELLTELDVAHLDIGQLCLEGDLARDFAAGGPSVGALHALRAEGYVRQYVLQVFPWSSSVAQEALASGHADGLIDGYIFYFNPLQRFATNALWDLLLEHRAPIIALRTIAGGNVLHLRDVPGAVWKDYLRTRAAEVAPIFERSGVFDWPEFCVRFVRSFASVCATVGATVQARRVADLARLAQGPMEPLDARVLRELEALQRRWSDEVDAHGTRGSM